MWINRPASTIVCAALAQQAQTRGVSFPLTRSGFNLQQLGPHPLAHRVALELEAPTLGSPTDVGQPKEVERRRLPLATPLSFPRARPPELDQARFFQDAVPAATPLIAAEARPAAARRPCDARTPRGGESDGTAVTEVNLLPNTHLQRELRPDNHVRHPIALNQLGPSASS